MKRIKQFLTLIIIKIFKDIMFEYDIEFTIMNMCHDTFKDKKFDKKVEKVFGII